MAGIYIHIPFCKQSCHYCNFHFSTSLRQKEQMLDAIQKEIALTAGYLNGEPIETIYFGGGTPSVLESSEIERLIDAIVSAHHIENNPEITLEANPDDLNAVKVAALRRTNINRFSIGVQSFHDVDLKYMNRAHNASEALSSIKRVQDAGFENITIDLIYGTPTMDDQHWKENIDTTLALQVPHISCYGLTVESKTALNSLIRRGKLPGVDEDRSAAQFELLMQSLSTAGFDHYEISNFARAGFYSRHNSAYWRGIPYLGIGPSAHSFNGRERQSNVANNPQYIAELSAGRVPFELEQLSPEQRFNEYVLVSMRTVWGTELSVIDQMDERYSAHFQEKIKPLIDKGFVLENDNVYTLSKKGKLMADYVAMELFCDFKMK